MSEPLIVKNSILHWIHKENSYKSLSLSNLKSAGLDPEGYLHLIFLAPHNKDSGVDGCVHSYFRLPEDKEIMKELQSIVKRNRIKEIFERLLIADPISPIETLMAKAEATYNLLEDKKMETCS